MAKGYLRANISKGSLIYPYFVVAGRARKQRIKNFPGVFRFSSDLLVKDMASTYRFGIRSVLLFGVPQAKDSAGSTAYSCDNPVAQAIKDIKVNFPGMTVIADVCLCAYTTHGHCGVLGPGTSRINRKATLDALSRTALFYARAGADWVAPSAMAKGQVLAIRRALDKSGFKKVRIMGYSAKFNSNFYWPFRDAADSAPRFADRSKYQLDCLDADKALTEIKEDIDEGADMVMVKPALSYLDIITRSRRKFNFPLAAYNVSGEYSMVKYASRAGFLDERKAVMEIISSIKRAGADKIISYHARDIAQWLRE